MGRVTAIYRGMDQTALDAGYNNTLAVSDSSALLQDFDERSAALRTAHGEHLDLRYGPAPRNRIDYFAAEKPGPLLIFIHGGYWQMRAKETFSFLAAGPLAHGIHVAMIGYTLAPDASLTEIVAEVRTAIGWLKANATEFGGDTEKMIVSGWSAGGHLTAMCVDEWGVIGGVAISGIYDLEPVRLSYLNDKLRLSDEEESSLSPLHLPLNEKPLTIIYGTGELPELQRQSEQFGDARRGLPGEVVPLPQWNHFTILNELAAVDGAITREVRKIAGV